MTIRVHLEDPHHPEATALLRQSHALMEELFPAESNHYLSIDALLAPEISFFAASDKEGIKGCAALADKGDYGELKSMFVSPDARGLGIAQLLLDQIETAAREKSLPKLMLETGYLLEAAHKLYRKSGFKDRGPFGDYNEDPNSLFMEKPL